MEENVISPVARGKEGFQYENWDLEMNSALSAKSAPRLENKGKFIMICLVKQIGYTT